MVFGMLGKREDCDVSLSKMGSSRYAGKKKLGRKSQLNVDGSLECDFDTNPTDLFLHLQKREWSEALTQCLKNPVAAKTWVVRREMDVVRWKLLPIHAAFIFKAPEEIIQTLLAANPNGPGSKDNQGKLPIHYAIYHGRSAGVVEVLLTACPQASNEKDEKGRTPLDLARASQSPYREEYLKLLGASEVNNTTIERTQSGTFECNYEVCPTNLFLALQRKQWDNAIAECQKQSSEAHTWVFRNKPCGKLSWKLLPIHAAIIYDAPEVVIKTLLETYPAGAGCKNDQGMLPLHLAFRHGSSKGIVERLLSAFPRSLEEPDAKGRKPIDFLQASTAPNRETFLQALKRGPNYYASAIAASERALAVENEKIEFESNVKKLESRHQKDVEKITQQKEGLVKEVTSLRTEWEKKKEATQVLVGVLNSLESQLEEMNAKEQSLATIVVNLDGELKEAKEQKEQMEGSMRGQIDTLLKEIEELKATSTNIDLKRPFENPKDIIDKVFQEIEKKREVGEDKQVEKDHLIVQDPKPEDIEETLQVPERTEEPSPWYQVSDESTKETRQENQSTRELSPWCQASDDDDDDNVRDTFESNGGNSINSSEDDDIDENNTEDSGSLDNNNDEESSCASKEVEHFGSEQELAPNHEIVKTHLDFLNFLAEDKDNSSNDNDDDSNNDDNDSHENDHSNSVAANDTYSKGLKDDHEDQVQYPIQEGEREENSVHEDGHEDEGAHEDKDKKDDESTIDYPWSEGKGEDSSIDRSEGKGEDSSIDPMEDNPWSILERKSLDTEDKISPSIQDDSNVGSGSIEGTFSEPQMSEGDDLGVIKVYDIQSQIEQQRKEKLKEIMDQNEMREDLSPKKQIKDTDRVQNGNPSLQTCVNDIKSCHFTDLEVNLTTKNEDTMMHVKFMLENAGESSAVETVQCYIRDKIESDSGLKIDPIDSQTITVESGTATTVEFCLQLENFSFHDDDSDVEQSNVEICIATSNKDIKLRKDMELNKKKKEDQDVLALSKRLSPRAADDGLIGRAVGSVVSASYTVMAPALISVFSLVAPRKPGHVQVTKESNASQENNDPSYQ